MKVLITGGAGFIGSAVVRIMIQSTDWEVVNLDKLTYAGNLDSLESGADSSRYSFERVDICDAAEVRRVFAQHLPDVVIHLAAESHVDRSIDGPAEFIKTNIVGSYTLLEESLRYFNQLTGARREGFRLLHVSTDEVYGDLGEAGYFVEASPYAPSSPYSASKASSDHLVRAWHRTYGLPVIVTNSSNNYGPCQYPEKLIPRMILHALSGKSLPIYGDGKQVRDWIYVEDHARALIQVVTGGVIGETYNIGGGCEKQNVEVVQTLCEIMNEKVVHKPEGVDVFEALITFVEDRPGHDRRYAIDATKIRSELGWEPIESFATGIRKTIEWYLENSWWCDRVEDGSYQV